MADDLAKLHVEFFVEAQEDLKASREQGRKVFRDVEMVRIRWVGDRGRVLVAPAHAESVYDRGTGRNLTYAERFPQHYEAFVKDRADLAEGTPLAEVSFVSKAQAAEWAALNIRTVENLAAVSDRDIRKLGMGARDYVEKARQWLERAKDGAAADKAEAEIARLRAEIEALKAKAAAPADPAQGDPFDAMSDDELRAFIAEKAGVEPRKNAAREKLLAAARDCADMSEAA